MNKETYCTLCNDELSEYELENPYKDEGGYILCDNCYEENYLNYCELCEESYEKPTKPEELFFVVAREVANEVAYNTIKPGIYQTISWPYYLAATGFGFETLFENSIKLVRELDINSILKKLYPHSGKIGAGEICPDCVKKYTSTGYIKRVDYCNKEYRLHRGIYERGVIKAGK